MKSAMLIKMQTFRRRKFNNHFVSIVIAVSTFIVVFSISSAFFFFVDVRVFR